MQHVNSGVLEREHVRRLLNSNVFTSDCVRMRQVHLYVCVCVCPTMLVDTSTAMCSAGSEPANRLQLAAISSQRKVTHYCADAPVCDLAPNVARGLVRAQKEKALLSHTRHSC